MRKLLPLLLTITCVAPGCGGGGSGAATSNAPATLRISSQPAAQTVQLGSALNLSVTATGSGGLSYQWSRNGVALFGATSSSYSVASASASETGSYSVIVSDSNSNTISSNQATVTVSNLDADQSFTQLAPRVLVAARQGRELKLPMANSDWNIQYRFVVPALPTKTWNPNLNVFYVWGDIDFDQYGANGTVPLSQYKFNQIVPQAFIGRVLSGNSSSYEPTYTNRATWGIQAQYFWQKSDAFYAMTGPIVNVVPGQVVATTIQYSAITGSITASITADNGTSSITITRPFPNEPGLFASWKEFFERAASRAGTTYVLSQPVLNLEPGGGADKQTLCTLLPFDIRGVTLPGVPIGSASYAFGLESGVPCTTQPAVLNF